jgi:hypothetical protein
MGWTFKYTDTEELRYYYLEIWWLPADDREYLVLQSHAIRAGYGDQIGFGMVLRPWCGDAGLKRQMMIEFGELLPGLLVGLVAAGIWRASIWRKSSVKAPKTTPLNGKVSVGGGFENTDGTNLNPVTHDDSGGPARDIPNHVLGRMEDMDQLFEPASVKLMISSKLRFQDVDWTRGTQAAARVMAPGGKVLMNVYAVYTDTDEEALRSAFVSAGFKNVQVKGDPPGTMVFATFGP